MIRPDGRRPEELRPINISRNYLPHAEGSVLFEIGNTKVVCAATFEAKVPTWRRGSGLGWVTAEYSMLPRATEIRTVREAAQGRVCGRTHEIQRLIGRSLRSVTDLSQLGGENTIWLDCDVICADGGTRTAAVTGAFISLYDCCSKLLKEKTIKEMPLTDFIAGVSIGVIDGVGCLDLGYGEDSQAEVDMNVIMNGSGKIVEIQGTAERCAFTTEQLSEMINLASKGVSHLIERQRSILLAPVEAGD